MKPITPDEACVTSLPDGVIEAVNELLKLEGHNSGQKNRFCRLNQSVIEAKIMQCMKLEPHEKHLIYNNHWLDFEEIYREAGWKVTYYKSPYYSTEPSYFEFERA